MNYPRNKISKSKINLTLLFTVLALLVVGVIMLFSASAVVGLSRGDGAFYAKRQLLSIAGGLFVLFIAYKIDYRVWRRLALPLFVFSLALLILVLASPLGISAQGARRWLNLGVSTFQPVELAKLAVIFYLSAWLARSAAETVRDFRKGLLFFAFILGSLFFLVIFQPDLGSFIVIAAVAAVLYFAGGASLKQLAFLGLAALILLGAAVLAAPYRLQRITTFLNPAADPLGAGYHAQQAVLAVGSGGLLGAGLGHSRQKFLYLPEVVGDSLFAVIAEELGFIFSLAIIVFFLLLLKEGIKISKNAPDKFGQLVAFGIVFWLCFQAFVNIGAILGLLPLTGIPLPFMSFGGSAILVSLAGVGILLNIHKNS